jgi:hypothetical protein
MSEHGDTKGSLDEPGVSGGLAQESAVAMKGWLSVPWSASKSLQGETCHFAEVPSITLKRSGIGNA